MPRVLPLLLVALAAFVVRLGYDRLVTLGAFRTNMASTLARSRALVDDIKFIPDTINAEDLHLDPVSGLIFAAVQEEDGSRAVWFPPLTRFAEPSVLEKAKGGLRVIDPKTFTARALKLDGFSGPFDTHGIDIIRDPDDPTSLYIYAVNHAPNPEYARTLNASIEDKAHSRIEIFHHVVGSDVATHIRTVTHPLIQTPNDVVAVSPFEFYVTNDHHYREGPMRTLEVLGTKLVAGWSTIIYADVDPNKGRGGKDTWAGVTAKVAHHGLHNNNGLGKTPKEGELLICDASGGVTYIARRRDDNTLEVLEEIAYESTIDNPSWFQDPFPETGHDASGIVNAGLATGLKLAHEIDDPNGPIPPLVWLSAGQTGQSASKRNWNTTLLFADDGSHLRSASAAVLIAIDPIENDGKKQAWLFASGFASKGAIAVKVDL